MVLLSGVKKGKLLLKLYTVESFFCMGVVQGFQYFSSVPVLHYLLAVLCIKFEQLS